MTQRQQTLTFALGLSVCIAVLYAFGLNNQLVFDDARLTDGSIFGNYGSLLEPKVRLLSYGTFVWIQAILGEGWKAQRVFNVALHITTTLLLYRLVLELLQKTTWSEETKADKDHQAKIITAAQIGTALWALNPVAVYAVGYLIQRSIVMATLFVVVACLSFVWGLTRKQPIWFIAAFLSYLLAIASKEYAVTSAALALPLYVFIQRPSLKRALAMVAASTIVLLLASSIFYIRYASIVGVLFDETSNSFATHLEQAYPGVGNHLFSLSIQNQASLFFRYGLTWLVPYVGWMSIDIRPTFPTSLFSWHTVGLAAYLGGFVISSWFVLTRKDAWGLMGLCLLIPTLLFTTEFATVWLQDPFVLYRSYLWSLTIPVVIGGAFTSISAGLSRKNIYWIGTFIGLLFVGSAIERITSLQSNKEVWTDASVKVDLTSPISAVGRARPFLNLGDEFIERGQYEEAFRNFAISEKLGETRGLARMNMGVALQRLNQHPEAINNFDLAQAQGYNEGALFYQKGESQFRLRRLDDALASFTLALTKQMPPEVRIATLARHAETAIALEKPAIAIPDYQELLTLRPNGQRYQIGLAMALMGNKDFASALNTLNKAIEERPTAQLFYARAITHYNQGNKAASLQDLEHVLKAEPNNPVYRGLEQKLKGTEKTASSSNKP